MHITHNTYFLPLVKFLIVWEAQLFFVPEYITALPHIQTHDHRLSGHHY